MPWFFLLSLLQGGVFGCTEMGCTSWLDVRLVHDLDLSAGPYTVEYQSPLYTITCTFGPDTDGEGDCDAGRLEYDASFLDLRISSPFVPEPGADPEPYDLLTVTVLQGDLVLATATLDVETGEPYQPNGDGCPPTCQGGTATGDLR